MAASVLNAPRAVAVSLYVVRAFIDASIRSLVAAIRSLMAVPKTRTKRIGFRP